MNSLIFGGYLLLFGLIFTSGYYRWHVLTLICLFLYILYPIVLIQVDRKDNEVNKND